MNNDTTGTPAILTDRNGTHNVRVFYAGKVYSKVVIGDEKFFTVVLTEDLFFIVPPRTSSLIDNLI